MTVEVPGRPYPVLVGRGALQEIPTLVRELGATAAAVVTDHTVDGAWAGPVRDALTGAGVRTEVHAMEPGERAKTLAELERVLAFLEASAIDRHGLVVALGGGTVGDLAGFAAAVWLRGVRCLQVPTTLLAMVDSAIGGRTGVNSVGAKDAIGAYWQPVAVVSDLAVLATLPDDEYLAAFGEIVKYAIAMDADLAATLESDHERLRARSSEALEPLVARCAELKARVVAADEREGGPRAILNYGHTVGHALESASGYTVGHGRAVAFGMEAAARIAAGAELCEGGLVATQGALLTHFGLPGALPNVTADAVLAAIPCDTNSHAGVVRWVMPRRLGRAQVGVPIPAEAVASVVRELLP